MLGEQILKLRAEGKSYNEISKILNCSKSTVSYWCNPNGKENTRKRTLRREKWKRTLEKKIDNFKRRKISNYQLIKVKDWKGLLSIKIKEFKKRGMVENNFTTTTLLASIKDPEHIKCYLTGRNIDITKDEYHLDHIMPIAKGGTCNADNLGFACPEANRSKSDMTLDEYLSLCKEVLENFGYKVIKEE